MTHRQVKDMNPDSMIEKVDVSKTKRDYRKEKPRYESNAAHDNKATKECDYCGYKHWPGRANCAAWGKQCSFCKAQIISVRNAGRHVTQYVLSTIRMPTVTPNGCIRTESPETRRLKKRVTALMQVNDWDVRILLDTGADVNTITQRFVHKQQVRQSSGKLIMWNGSKVSPVGATTLTVTNPKTHEKHEVDFVVVQNDLTCLIGSTTVQEMGLLTVQADQFVAEVNGSPQDKRTDGRKTDDESRPSTQKTSGGQGKCAPTNVGVRSATTCHAASKHEVDDLGSLGTATLTTVHNVRARILPSRKLPISLQKPVKEELDTLVKRGVLIPVDEPTPWVSQMAVVHKKNGMLRLCIDPQPLNEALMREHYKLPNLDDVLPNMNKAKVFSKVDEKEAFWHVELDAESSLLTTMITSFGRYRWARLPFGLKVSSELFRKRLNEALEGLAGVICVADDILVTGCGDTTAMAERDHDENWKRLKQRCKDRHNKLNDDKAVMKQDRVTFMGHSITRDGIKADDAKVKAILEMPAPTDIHGVKRFCGMIQYLARFMPDLAGYLEPLRKLTRQKAEWDWSPEWMEAFNDVKRMISDTPILAYFDPEKELVLQLTAAKMVWGQACCKTGSRSNRLLAP